MEHIAKTARDISLERANTLKNRIKPYLKARENIPTGLEQISAIQKRHLVG